MGTPHPPGAPWMGNPSPRTHSAEDTIPQNKEEQALVINERTRERDGVGPLRPVDPEPGLEAPAPPSRQHPQPLHGQCYRCLP